jgi:SulP family sulfate permease
MKALVFHSWSPAATILASATVATMIVCRILSPRIPGAILAMLGATGSAYFAKPPGATIATRFGGIPSGLPDLAIPRWHAGLEHGLLGPAFTVAMLERSNR